MKTRLFLYLALVSSFCRIAGATQADDTTITITAQNAGATPFINQLELTVSDTSFIKSIQFVIDPKPSSVTRPLSATYAHQYLVDRGYLIPGSGEIFLPVYGLYADYGNTVTLTYYFLDGSSKQDSTTITTAAFDDPCGYDKPEVVQARTDSTALSYDFVMVKGDCNTFSPGVIDTDSALRWVGTGGLSHQSATFFDNAFYQSATDGFYRIDLDGTVTLLFLYSDIGVTGFHHNVDRGKVGLLVEADTADQIESVFFEIDGAGKILKRWDMADIIRVAMTAGGDDPSEFVFDAPTDWFHQNAATYNRADDTVIVSSRESFVIALDYETNAIKWILGDPTKKWHQFPSLTQYALAIAPGSLPPIGQHALSIAFDQGLLLLDNGLNSIFQNPPGDLRAFAAPRKYQLDLDAKVATEVWNYEMDQTVASPICGATYEDAPLNYLVNYAFENGFGAPDNFARILGLDAAGNKIFDYRYPTVFCDTIFNAIPLHFENTSFPTVEARALNISTRGLIGTDEDSLIGGFIVSGTESQTVVLRALGPSLSSSGVAEPVADPMLTLFDASGTPIASNDDWESDPGSAQITAEGLAPGDPAEAATVQVLTPGAYTFVVTGKDGPPGVGLVEAYDVSPLSDSRLANISTRGLVGTDDEMLISGFIVGDVASATIVVRAIGPSLASAGLSNPLLDPMLTVYDSNGAAIGGNDNWQDDISASVLQQDGLAPTDDAESATILHLPAGAYTTVVSGVDGGTGTGLVEAYNLE